MSHPNYCGFPIDLTEPQWCCDLFLGGQHTTYDSNSVAHRPISLLSVSPSLIPISNLQFQQTKQTHLQAGGAQRGTARSRQLMFMVTVLLVIRNHQGDATALTQSPDDFNLSQLSGVFCIPQSGGWLQQNRRCTIPTAGAGTPSKAEAPGKRHVRKARASFEQDDFLIL